MDKNRDVRRGGASRFSPAKRHTSKQSGLDGGGGEVMFSEKSKKERVRKLSVVGKVSSSNQDSEMSCVGFDVEDELRTTTSIIKRSKLPKKFFDDCNTVDHASVPRKLRSAMKKRNRDSISPPFPDSKKPNHAINGIELPKKNGQQGDSKGSPRQAIVGSITKDEEEVVETLSALAVLFPSSDKTNKATVNGENSKAKSLTLPVEDESMLVFEDSAVPEKEEKTICPSTTIEAANLSSDLEGSARETEEVKSLKKPSQGKQLYTELDDSVRQVNLRTISLSSESELTNKKPSCTSIGFNVPSELSPGTGSKQSKCEETSACVIKAEIALESAAAVSSQHGLEHTIKENKNNGSALWPGLSSTGSHGAETQGPSLQSSAAKIPAWLGNAAYATQPGSVDNRVLTEKNSRVLAKRKTWKRCSAHVYISRLTEVLQIGERKERLPMQATQLMSNEGSKQVVVTAVNNLNGIRKCLSGIVSADGIVDSAAEKKADGVTNAILLHKRLLQDQQQTSMASGLYTLQKQCLDFLSLSAGGGGAEANNSCNKMGYGLKPSTQPHGPYLQLLAQNHTAMPLSPQNHYSSTPFPDHLPAAAAQQAQVQAPPYFGSPFWGPLQPVTTSSLKQQQQQQQQQQLIWAAQLAAQFKPEGVAAPHIPNWQNGRQDSPSMIHYAQAILPPPRSSLEVLGPKYGPILQQQQQQLIAITSSLPSAKMKRQQHHNLPSGYGGNGGGFQPDGAPSLQLLCNEQL